MTIVALASFKGSPGVTTAAVCLTATWPTDALLVEADPAGGDLVARWEELDPAIGLVRLGSAARRSVPTGQIAENIQRLGGKGGEGIDVIVGVDHHSQAIALQGAWPNVMEALAATGRDVIIDLGRLLPDLSGGARAILSVADVAVIVMRATLDSALKVKNNLGELNGIARSLGLLVIGEGYGDAEIASVLGIEVAGRLPYDEKGAAMAGGLPVRNAKSALAGKCAQVAQSLFRVEAEQANLPVILATDDAEDTFAGAGIDQPPVVEETFEAPSCGEPSRAEETLPAAGEGQSVPQALGRRAPFPEKPLRPRLRSSPGNPHRPTVADPARNSSPNPVARRLRTKAATNQQALDSPGASHQ